MQFEAETIEELKKVASELVKVLKPGVIIFQAEMGAGKTTLIKEICKELEIEDEPTSPTYSIVNEYYSKKHGTIYHFDCYRLETEEEALDFGIEEYLDSGKFCFVEWPENIHNLLPKDCVRINIQVKQETRIISLEV